MSKKLKKSHKWARIPMIEARCPYCRKTIKKEQICAWEGVKISCPNCRKKFLLGRLK